MITRELSFMINISLELNYTFISCYSRQEHNINYRLKTMRWLKLL